MRQPSARFSTFGCSLRWFAIVTIITASGCSDVSSSSALQSHTETPAPQSPLSPFECGMKGGWKDVTDTTFYKLDYCEGHGFDEIPPLAERVTSTANTATIIEIDSKGTPCSPSPNWSVDVTGSSISIQLYARPATAQFFPEVVCIQVMQPYMLRFRVHSLAGGSYKVNVDDDLRDEHETATIEVPAR